MKAKSDYVFLSILGLLIANTVYTAITDGILLDFTNYLAFGCWLVAILVKLINNRFAKYVTGTLLILGTVNICNFLAGTTWISFGFIKFNPTLFIILLIWYFVNKRAVDGIVSSLVKGSPQEQADKHKKAVEFYTNKFKDCSDEELQVIYADFDNYPVEAQIALNNIKSSRS